MDEGLQKLKAASAAAILTRCITHPLDTIKTRIQYASGKVAAFKNIRDLYHGLPVSLVFSVPAVSLYLMTYDISKESISSNLLSQTDPTTLSIPTAAMVHGVSAGIAEAVSGLFWTPMEIMKAKQQASTLLSKKESYSTRHLIQRIYHQNGIQGFYNGYWLGLGVFLPQTMVYFITYERLKLVASQWYYGSSREKTKLPAYYYTLCAGVSGALAGGISNIMDIVKTRIQVGQSSKSSALKLIKHMYKHEGGMKAFTRGMLARVVYVMPSVCISFTIYEVLK